MKIHRDILEDVVKAFYSNANNLFNGRRSDEIFRTNIERTYFKVNICFIIDLEYHKAVKAIYHGQKITFKCVRKYMKMNPLPRTSLTLQE